MTEKDNARVYYAIQGSQEPSTFSVVKVDHQVNPGDLVPADPGKWLFEDDASLGSQFFGLGIITKALEAGQDLLLIFNPQDKGINDKE